MIISSSKIPSNCANSINYFKMNDGTKPNFDGNNIVPFTPKVMDFIDYFLLDAHIRNTLNF